MHPQRRPRATAWLSVAAVLAACITPLSQAKGGVQADTGDFAQAQLLAQVSAPGTQPAVSVAGASWQGTYRMHWMAGTDEQDAASMRTLQLRAKGKGWLSRFDGDQGQQQGLLFSPATAQDYAELGWARLHATGRMRCLFAGSMAFVCRTRPGATVPFLGAADGQLTTQSGLFGVMHQGGFELTPLD